MSAKQLLEELKECLPAGLLDTPGMSRALSVLSMEELPEGSAAASSSPPSGGSGKGGDKDKEKGDLELRRAGRFVAWLRLHADLDPVSFSFAISSDKEKK